VGIELANFFKVTNNFIRVTTKTIIGIYSGASSNHHSLKHSIFLRENSQKSFDDKTQLFVGYKIINFFGFSSAAEVWERIA